eukprot:TRINITY_DN90_c0_g1_i2.p1 TRINITY_DN90_c0_g1~~TRINITY_DN90_c0_g1_i2.p1  ORF type:complete len:202 (+),score=40.65 TRINITY_DN90_c0_g1_i2:166-771(+)
MSTNIYLQDRKDDVPGSGAIVIFTKIIENLGVVLKAEHQNQLFGRRPFSKEEEDIDYDAADSGIEWYGDVEEKDLLMDDEEGEWLHEELETFSDDEMQEGIRPDGYEDDGFLCEDVNIYFKKTRKKEERYPIKPSRGRGSEDVKPIILKLPQCKPILKQEKQKIWISRDSLNLALVLTHVQMHSYSQNRLDEYLHNLLKAG